MGPSNVNFKLLSLNARGIRTFEKRKAIFSWLSKSGADICFLQETYSTSDVENIWNNQWRGNLFFSHGTCHSKGVLVLVRDNLDFNLQTVKIDPEGRCIMLDAIIQDSRYCLLNIYAPNKCRIRVLYENVSSCVLNNGFSTGPFSLGRGVRQGDPLSPYLFIIALEVLAIRIRNDNTIQGFKFGEENVKLNLFGDDMTCFLSDKGSYISLFRLLEDFGECSGLKVNHEKTEALVFGDSSLWEDVSNMYTLRNVIKILGVYFGGNGKERDDLNYRETLKSIKKSLNLWKWRELSLLGRIQIVKTIAIPKLMFRASAIPISKELLKNADSIFYSFIWNGKDKVKRNVLTATIKNGGLNMLDIDSMVHTKRVLCLKKYLEDYPSPWKFFLDERLLSVGGKFVLHCNLDSTKLPVLLLCCCVVTVFVSRDCE